MSVMPQLLDAPQTGFKMVDVTGDGQGFAVEVLEVVKGWMANGNEEETRDEKEDVNKMREEGAMMMAFSDAA